MDSPEEKKKKRSYRKLALWLLGDLSIAFILILLLLHKPAGYDPIEPNNSGNTQDRIDPYLTHLGSELYNGAQTRAPFDLVVLEAGINQAIAQSNWPRHAEGVSFSRPAASFTQAGIMLRATAQVEGVDLVVTLVGQPSLLDNGQLRLYVSQVKIGAMSVTPMARIVGRKMYREQLNYIAVDEDDLRTQIANALIEDQSFDPVFRIDGRFIRLIDLKLEEDKLTLRFMPLGKRPR